MKKSLPIVFISLLILGACGNPGKDTTKDTNDSKIEFESTSFDFGKIAFASDGTCIFRFTNTSMKPLIVNVVRTTCGCTNPEWPKDPVEPGKMGEIKVTYNTRITGRFQKSITVFCNAVNSPVKLFIKGDVQPDPATASSSSKK